MSRRRGQTGYVWQKNQNGNKKWNSAAPSYGQVWVDVPGKERQRKFYQLGVCRTRSDAKRRLKEMIERDGINSTVEIAQSIDSTTFDQQAEWWIKAIEDGRVLHRRKRTRMKPATIDGYKCAISWLSPHIGKTPLANIKNAAAKELVANMKQTGLSDKTIVSYFQVLQSVIASVVNDEGEQVHPRTWDSHFIGLPVVNPKKQNRPTRTAMEIEKIIAASWNRYRVLYSLLAGTGLRIGEALALKIGQHISDNCSTIHVHQSLWRGKEQEPKTQAAVRDVDITRELATLLAKFIGDRRDGYLFCTETGKPLSPVSLPRASAQLSRLYLYTILYPTSKSVRSCHSTRRFRNLFAPAISNLRGLAKK
jgi:integrase